MAITTRRALHGHRPTFAELFTPKLVTVLREGYGLAGFRADVIAGLTVAIVALPLSMAIAIASGVTPDRGLTTAVIGGFIVSLLGGSRFQIGGPAGAFIVLVALTAERHGVDGVILATLMAGVILIAAGYLRLGTYIKFIPYPVTVGFTCRHRRRHLRNPDQGSVRHYAGERAGRTGSETAGARRRAAHDQFFGGRSRRDQHRHHRRLEKTAAGLARHPDRGRLRGGCRLGAGIAGGNHRHQIWRHPAGIAMAGVAGVLARQGAGRASRRDFLRTARRHRIAVVGRGGRRHDRPPASLELRTGGAGVCQHRLGAVRRHLRHRHHRAHRDQCPRRRAKLRFPACCIRCFCCCSC